MDLITEIIDETGLSIYETKSLLESLHIVLECSSLNNQKFTGTFAFQAYEKQV